MSFPISIALVSSLFLIVAALERVPALQFRPATFLRPYLLTDVAWYGIATAAAAVSAFVFRPQLAQLAIPGIAGRVGQLPSPALLLIGVVAYDLVAFFVHVAIHRFEPLWNVHKVHHSSRHLDWLATTRTHMFEHLVRNLPAQAVLFAIGVPANIVVITLFVYVAFALFEHSNLAIAPRWFEQVFITPRLHRSHHVPSTSQRNFGTIFSFWDRALGTLTRRDTRLDEVLGVPGELDTYPQRFIAAARKPLSQTYAQRGTPPNTRHDSILSRVGASKNPGAVHSVR